MTLKMIAIVGLAVLLLASNAAWMVSTQGKPTPSPTEASAANFPLLSKRIFAEDQNDMLINFIPLRRQLEAKFSALAADVPYSFYFEYLPSGTSIRIGDDRELIAASLIKVPLVMNLYKAAELRRVNLEQVITIQESQLDHSYGELWQRGAGTTLTLRELAKLTLAESDNTASRAIFDQIQSKLSENEQSLAQLDIDQNTYDGQAVINARSYSSVLKSLYLSSYLNRDHSSELLNFLTQSNENTRLTKLLPSDLAVAHKNGVYNREWSESDCGIVYAKARPYSVCIMVGLPDDQAGLFMAETSKLIFDYVTSYQR